MKQYILIVLFLFALTPFFSQTDDRTLINADKHFIDLSFSEAASDYEKYLEKNPKDFYASRQAAICYQRLNNQTKAIDHWTNVYDNSQASEKDKLEYGRCLLSNYRTDDAKRVFIDLIRSQDPFISAWGKAFRNMNAFYEDSSLCKIYEVFGLSSEKSEFSPYVCRNEIIYVTEAQKSKPIRLAFPWSSENSYIIYSSGRTDSTTYKKGEPFNKFIQSKYTNGPVCFTPDDSVIYYTRAASKEEMKQASTEKNFTYKLQIFYTEVNTFGVAHPEIKPFPYNSTSYDCMHPAIDRTGKKIYFSSDMPGGIGGKDIWMCEKNGDTWGKPVNLGPNINTSGNETFPFISRDGVLYFASDLRPGLGGLDIFFADPDKQNNQFKLAENAGAGINTQFDDFGIFLYPNGKKGYLSSNRKNGLRNDDIYFFVNNKPRSFESKINFIDEESKRSIAANFTITTANDRYAEKTDSTTFFITRLKPEYQLTILAEAPGYKTRTYSKEISENDTLISIELETRSKKCILGKIIDKETGKPLEGMKVAIYDEDGTNYLNAVTDTSGTYKICKLPLDKDLYIGSEKKPDYFTSTERFRIKKDSDLLKDIYTQKIVVGKPIKIDNIYFDKGKFDVRPDATKELDKVVKLMKDNPEVIIELSSHTDCYGPAKDNLILSDKRAKSSAAYIVKQGVEAKRIKGKGYGESKLVNDCKCEGNLASDCEEEQHAENRRVEIKVTGFVKQATPKK